jgi:hypothetical protein
MSRGLGTAQRFVLRYLQQWDRPRLPLVESIAFDWAAHKEGMTPEEFDAEFMDEHGACPTPRSAAESINRAVRSLRDRGLLIVVADFDGHHLMLTAAGEAIAPKDADASSVTSL